MSRHQYTITGAGNEGALDVERAMRANDLCAALNQIVTDALGYAKHGDPKTDDEAIAAMQKSIIDALVDNDICLERLWQ